MYHASCETHTGTAIGIIFHVFYKYYCLMLILCYTIPIKAHTKPDQVHHVIVLYYTQCMHHILNHERFLSIEVF